MLASNRAFLQERFPSVLSKIQSVKNSLPIEKTKYGLLTCKYHGRFLHSPYDPAKEARDTLASLGYSGQSTVLLVSAGLGYGLASLAPSVRTVIVIEKDPAVFEALCGTADLPALAGKFLDFVLLVDPRDVEVTACLDSLSPASLMDLFLWEHRPVTEADADGFFNRVRGFVKSRLDRLLSEMTTTGYFAPVWFANTLRNLKFLDGAVDLSMFKNAFAAFPAAVVSAGPSLDETVSRLKPAADGVVVISAATAVRRLMAEGIVPHFVVSTDAGHYNSWHTRGLELGSSILVSDLSVSHLVPRTCSSRRAWLDFNLGFHDAFTKPGLDLPKFNMAGTVASTSVELARFLGCSAVWLFGQDFAFTDGRSHCRRTIHETWGLARQNRTATLETLESRSVLAEKTENDTDYKGQKVLTSVKLKLYKEWFEKNYRGLNQTSLKSARLATAQAMDFTVPASKAAVSGIIEKIRAVVKRNPDPGTAMLVADAVKKLELSGSIAEFFAGLDSRLSGGMRTFIEFELFRASRGPQSGVFPPAVRAKLRSYLRSLSRLASTLS